MNKADLLKLSETDISAMELSGLVDIARVSVDISEPAGNRMTRYVEQVHNPYCFLCGKTPVKIIFNANGETLDEAICNHMKNQKY